MKRQVKKLVAGMLTLALVAGAVSANVGGFLTEGTAIVASAATESWTSGECTVTYDINTKTLTVSKSSGNGAMSNYISASKPQWYTSYRKTATKIVIESGVTHIGEYAFHGMGKITSVEIPSTVTTIGAHAFQNTIINTVTIPDSVTTIGEYAFNSTPLTSISIPSSVTSIGSNAFLECQKLKTVNFEERSTTLSVGAYAFSGDQFSFTPNNLKYTSGASTEPSPLTFTILTGSNPITIQPNITYTEVPAVEPTCTTAGNIKYYVGSDNKLYEDDQGTRLTDRNNDGVINIDDTVIAAKGHSYTSPIWSWVKINGEYTVTVKFKCSECGDIITPDTQPILTYSDDTNGTRIYTASIHYNDLNYTSTMNDSASYDITVNGSTSQYKYGTQVKAVAAAPEAGKYFDGWYEGNKKVSATQTYYFYATRDIDIEAKYADNAVETAPVYSMNVSRSINANTKQKISFTVDWELPADYQLIEAGVVRSYTNENPEIGGEGVSKKASTLKTARGTFKYNVNLSAANSDKTVYSKAYVTYMNKLTNEQVTVYTGLFTTVHV